MSVDKRRLAAAQRTAALRSTSITTPGRGRAKLLRAWIIIVPALSFFSFSLVAGAAGFGAKPDLAAAAAKVVPAKADPGPAKPAEQDSKGKPEPKKEKDDGSIVVVDSSKGEASPLAKAFGNGGAHQVCWISASQLTRVSAVYRTTKTSLTVEHTTYSLVTVYGANESSLKQLLGGPSSLKCRLVQVVGLFFLPFDPNMS